MVTLAIALLVVAAVAIVGWPFMGHTLEPESFWTREADPVVENLVVQRDSAYAAIKDLDFDHSTGKLSDADYKHMRAKCEARAMAILQELDSLQTAKAKRVRPGVDEEALEREVRQLRRGSFAAGSSACPKCGTAHTANDAFCAKCGASLRGMRCPACGTRAAIGDKFCARCGARTGA
jgi:hypothetical protein